MILSKGLPPTMSYAELSKMLEHKRAVEPVNLLEANLSPDFLAKLEAEKTKQEGINKPETPVTFPIEV